MADVTVASKVQGSRLQKGKARPYDLNKVNKSYLVFCDTCSFMAEQAQLVLRDGLSYVLKKQDMKLIVAKRVIDELYKHQANTKNLPVSSQAKKGLKIIQEFQQGDLCDIFEDKNDPFADNLFLSVFTKFRQSHNLLMITNDNNLAYDLLGLTEQKSVQSNKRIEVCFIGVDGDLIQYKSQSQITQSAEKKSNSVGTATLTKPKFSVSKTLKAKYTERPCKDIPEVGGIVATESGDQYKLEKKIAEGGEGSTYLTNKGLVCKIYRKDRLTEDRYQKLLLMTASPINYQGICWPQQIVYNKHKEFVGYVMPLAKGSLLQRCVFLPMLMKTAFPNWNRLNLVKLAITITKNIEYLHNNNVIMGDINPLNIMVNSDEEVYFIDTDSYQIDGYPCPVGTVHFTAPEVQGKDFKTFLRTIEHEKYAIATLIFMILLPGKPPYSQVDGASPSENIRKQNFSFPLGEESNQKAPKGPWRFIWSHLSFALKEAFFGTFKSNKRLSASEWLSLLSKYKYNIENGYNTDQIFPKLLKIVDPIEVNCDKCGNLYTASKEFIEKLATEGKKPLCDKCREEIKTRVGSRSSVNNGSRSPISQPAYRPQPSPPSPRPSTTSSQYQSSTQPTYRSQTPNPQIPPRVQPVSQTANTNQNSSNSTSKKGSGSGCLVSIGTFVFTIILIYVIQILI